MKKTILYSIAIAIVIIIGYLALPKNYYLRRALIYQKVNIEDYTIFSNREIPSDKYVPWKIDDRYNKKEIPDTLLKKIESFNPVAFLVIQDSTIVFEKYWKGYHKDSLSNSFSMAKSIVSLLVGAAIDEGLIESVHQPVAEFIPEYQNEKNCQLQLRDVLNMSSGLNWEESYSGPFSLTTKAYYGNNLHNLIAPLEVVEKPGETFKYLSGDTQLLAFIVQAATNKNISQYTYEKFWKYMGAKNSALWCLDNENGMEKAYCCFNSTAQDFARWGQLILAKGNCNGKQLISKDYLSMALSPARYLKTNEGKAVDFYGFQWWMIPNYKGMNIKYMRGILGQYVIVIPEKNAVVVRLGQDRSTQRYKEVHPQDMIDDIEAALAILE